MTESRNTGDLFAKGHRATVEAPQPGAASPGSMDAAGGSPVPESPAPTVDEAAPSTGAVPQPTTASAAAGTPGARLRAARIAQQLPIADCARSLHLPVKVLQALEANDFGSADDFVFRRGALHGYARLLGLPPASLEESLRSVAPAAQPALVAVARTSRAHWLLQRYGTAATYMVLTAMIVVPLVFIGLRGGLQRPDARIVSLDQAAAPAPVEHAHAPAASPPSPAIDPAPDTTPFRASLAPFSAMGFGDLTAAPAIAASSAVPASATSVAPAPVPPAADGQHTLALTASADCWYEITDGQGNRIDSGMLHAGDSRTWHSAGPVHVTLGNAGAVAVTEDGKPYVLADAQHANVARFDLFQPAGASGSD